MLTHDAVRAVVIDGVSPHAWGAVNDAFDVMSSCDIVGPSPPR